ncbi:TPA: rod shape-determining protein MreC [Streptococcus suis]|nr:rod shape-determining protein MreC [Streptococcus suis]
MVKFYKYIIAIFLFFFVSISLLFATYSNSGGSSFIGSGLRVVVNPFQRILSVPVVYISSQIDLIDDLFSAYSENRDLKRIFLEFDTVKAENDSLKKEIESLKANLELSSSHPDLIFLVGEVLVRTPSLWTKELIINIGESSSISENSLVLSNGGVIGTISTVSTDSAVVKLITDSDDFTKIPVKIGTGDNVVYGILSGYDLDSNNFIINQLNSNTAIEIGSPVVTSDLAGVLPASLKIGEVSSVIDSIDSLNREVYIKPTANFSNIYSVSVVTQ